MTAVGTPLDSHLIVVRRQLAEELLDSVFLARAVHIGHLVLREGAVVSLHLTETQRGTRWHGDNQFDRGRVTLKPGDGCCVSYRGRRFKL